MTSASRTWAIITSRSALPHALAILITLYGGLLRLDAYVQKYGPLSHPRWARVMTRDVARLAAAVRLPHVGWAREVEPYVGGDPITYIEFGRSMTTFYQAHVREPVFVALTSAGIWALDGQDAGVSLASAVGSTLAIFATYLVGRALFSPWAGLIAALLTATEIEMVSWAVDGWRDDTFTAAILFTIWSLLRLRARPSFANAVLAGLVAGAACLTRITAITLIAPALAWMVIDRGQVPRLARLKGAATAVLILAVVVAPYLMSCAIATGDPLIAINYHTRYYRFAENQPIDKPMSAAEYIRHKLTDRPVATIDTGFNGLFVQPFVTKWNGFPWAPWLGRFIRVCAVVGIGAMPFFAAGRLLLVAVLGSLVPYMFTWNVGGGNAWRFTMHAYPCFFVAAAVAIVGAVRAVRAARTTPALVRGTAMPFGWRTALVLAIGTLGVAAYVVLPWFVVREAIAKGESTSVETGERDRVFYRTGWSAPHLEGITVRVSLGARAVVRLPLPQKRAYDIALRIDPVTPTSPEQMDVLVNRTLVGRFHLVWNPERVGTYRVHVREDIVNAGSNELVLIPSATTTTAAAGPRFAWLDPSALLGVRLWYVRVVP